MVDKYFAGFIILFCLIYLPAVSQKSETQTFSGSFQNQPLKDILLTIQSSKNISIFYHSDWLGNLEYSGSFIKSPLDSVFDQLLDGTGLSWIVYDDTNIVLLDASQPISLLDLLEKNKSYSSSSLLIIGKRPEIDKPANIKGDIVDENSREPLIGATIFVEELKKGVVTDVNGHFDIIIPTGHYHFRIESVGYDEKLIEAEVIASGPLNIKLTEGALQLKEILITETRIDENVQSVSVGIERMDMKVMRNVPQFMGETDIIKGLITLPGVSTVGEGASGFNVRGGTVGQNLILQDEALIFNSSHLFGFFSAFNPDVVRDVTLYKGNPPATQGGRLSSILDVRLKNGSSDRIHVSGGIGTVSSKLEIDGPIFDGKGDFLLGGRVSYINWFLNTLNNPRLSQSEAHFYDLNARFNFKISKNDRITISGYKSFDDFKLVSDTVFTWETQNASAIWRHTFTEDFQGDLSLSYGQFNTGTSDLKGSNAFTLNSFVHHLKTKLLFGYQLEKHKLEFGGSAINYSMNPGTFIPGASSENLVPIDVDKENAWESSLFISDEFNITDKLSLTAGLRYSHYNVVGPKTVYIYEHNIPKNDDTIIDSLQFGANESIKSYGGFEPRISIRYLVAPTASVKFGYARNRQYVHLISNTTAISPQDYWQSSTYYIPPEIGDQVSVGYFQNFENNAYEFSVEGFYKYLDQTIDYKEAATVLLNEKLEQDIIVGIGKAYGVEFLLKKNTGRFKGWMSYTWSRSLRKFESPNRDENISQGKFFPSNYDKPHEVSFLMDYKLSKGIKFTANFTYNTGRPVTAPVSKYSVQHILSVMNYSQRNQFRIPDYHRLDIAFIFGVGRRKDKLINDELIFSIYNVYGRKNAYSVYFNQGGFANKLSILGTVFPSISYNFKI